MLIEVLEGMWVRPKDILTIYVGMHCVEENGDGSNKYEYPVCLKMDYNKIIKSENFQQAGDAVKLAKEIAERVNNCLSFD